MEGSESHGAAPGRGGPHVAVRRSTRVAVLTRWCAAGAFMFLAFAFIQSLRHPARLWSPGLMGRVLAWGADVEGACEGDGPSS